MNVTECEMKCRQLHKEGQPQMESEEQKEYVVAHDTQKITENNLVNRYLVKEDLLESILAKGRTPNPFSVAQETIWLIG